MSSLYQAINIKVKNHHRLIIFLLFIGYIVLIIYLDEEDKKEDYEQYLDIFRHDKEFFKKLYEMDPKVRDRYLKTIKKIMDDKDTKSSKKVRILNKIKNTAIFAGLTEFILGGGGVGSFLTATTRTAFNVGLTGAFT